MTELVKLVGTLVVELMAAGRLAAKAWDMSDEEITAAVSEIRGRYARDADEYERVKAGRE